MSSDCIFSMSGGFYMRLWWKQTNIWQNLKMLSCLLIYGSCSMWSKYVEYTVALRYSRMTGKQNVRALCQWTWSAMLSWRLNTRRRHQLSHRTTRVMREGSERNMNVWTKVHDNQQLRYFILEKPNHSSCMLTDKQYSILQIYLKWTNIDQYTVYCIHPACSDGHCNRLQVTVC